MDALHTNAESYHDQLQWVQKETRKKICFSSSRGTWRVGYTCLGEECADQTAQNSRRYFRLLVWMFFSNVP